MFTTIPTFTLLAPTLYLPLPVATAPEVGCFLVDERLINGYVIRDLTGIGLNADFYLDVVVETFSGGTHCCFGIQVFSLRPSGVVIIMQKTEPNADTFFGDLNVDGVSEFITYDDSFAYGCCPYPDGVTVKVVLAYNAGQDRYILASLRYLEQYTDGTANNEGHAVAAPGAPSAPGECDGTNACVILLFALDYLEIVQQALFWLGYRYQLGWNPKSNPILCSINSITRTLTTVF